MNTLTAKKPVPREELIDQRIEELMARYPPKGRLNYECTCTGAVLYVLGLIDEHVTGDNPEEFRENINESYETREVSLSRARKGDVLIILNGGKAWSHSGVIYVPSCRDPLVFSKHKNHHCDILPLSKLCEDESSQHYLILRLQSRS